MKLLDLFSGVGGFSLGLEAAGFETVAFAEAKVVRRDVLRRHWPNAKIYDDVKAITASGLARAGLVPTAICGGFPCQDISLLKREAKGLAGTRSGLWAEYRRLIVEIRPKLVFIENVPALRSRGLEEILWFFAAQRYDAEWHCIPAAAYGAPHERDRLWIVAYPNCQSLERLAITRPELLTWATEPALPRVDDGFPDWMVESMGDALVPQVAEAVGKAALNFYERVFKDDKA